MILTATKTDGAQIRDIAARTGFFTQEEVDCVAAIWEEFLNDGPQSSGYNFIVDRDGDRVQGFAVYGWRDMTEGVYDLYWIAVDPDCHRKGVGRRLLAVTEEAIRKEGGRILWAETSGTPLYEPTRAFYLGMGFVMEACIKDFYKQGDDLAVFVKRL